MSSRLAIFGGTFNPPHYGHLRLAQEAYSSLDLDRVVFVPAAKNPLKEQAQSTTNVQRQRMLQLALGGDSRFELNTVELERGGVSYTIDTLEWFHREFPEHELFLLIGADSSTTLKDWKDISEYRRLCTIAVANRPGSIGLAEELSELLEELHLRYVFVQMPPTGISSRELRQRVATGLPITYFVPDTLAEYIRSEGLYLSS